MHTTITIAEATQIKILMLSTWLLLLLRCPGLRVQHLGRRMQQDDADEARMMEGPPMGTGT
jgi:hypothetical protein